MNVKDVFEYRKAVRAKDSGLTSTETLVLLEISEYYNWSNQDACWPSNETIAEGTKLNIRTVIKAKNSLVKKGWLESERRFNKSNLYVPKIGISQSETISQGDMSHSDTMSLDECTTTMSRGESSSPHESNSPQGCTTFMSGGEPEYQLTKNITKNLTKNIVSEADMESEVISQEEELFVPESFVEEVALETRGISIPSDHLKYLDSSYTPDVIHKEVPLKEDYLLIMKTRGSLGIF